MKLENFYIEHSFVHGEREVTFNWEDDGLTFYVLAEYGLDAYSNEVALERIVQSECWSEVEPITKFVLSDVMLDYLEDELVNYQKTNPSVFLEDYDNDYLNYWI
jgi:hypothetical protein